MSSPGATSWIMGAYNAFYVAARSVGGSMLLAGGKLPRAVGTNPLVLCVRDPNHPEVLAILKLRSCPYCWPWHVFPDSPKQLHG